MTLQRWFRWLSIIRKVLTQKSLATIFQKVRGHIVAVNFVLPFSHCSIVRLPMHFLLILSPFPLYILRVIKTLLSLPFKKKKKLCLLPFSKHAHNNQKPDKQNKKNRMTLLFLISATFSIWLFEEEMGDVSNFTICQIERPKIKLV